jgi:hypothetical protein
MATVGDRLAEAFFATDPAEPAGRMDRLRRELAELPEAKLRQLLMEFGQHVCADGTPEEDLYAFWEAWNLPGFK